MPKIKTKRSACKRFRITASGRIKRLQAYKRHNTGKKRSKVTRRLRKNDTLTKGDKELVKRMIPGLSSKKN